MIIVIFTPGFPPWRLGGEEYYTYYQANKLVELGHTVYVVAENKSNNETGKINIEEKLNVILTKPVNNTNKLIKNILIFRNYFQAYLKHIKNKRPNIIHGHDTIGPGLAAVLIGKMFRLPVFVTWHGAELLENRFTLLGDLIRKIVCNYSNGVIVSSSLFLNLALSKIGQKNKSKFTIIPPAVDINEFTPENYSKSIKEEYDLQESLIVLTVGRLERVKGYDVLLESIPPIVEKHPNVKFLIVGTGSLEEKLSELVKKLNISENVIFTGPVPREVLPKIYSACDIFVLPTRGEGFGMVYLEAWSSGKPIITTPHAPVIVDLIEKEGGGIVSPNEPSQISSAISILLADQNLRHEMGLKGREIALGFSWRNMVKKNISFYMNSISNREHKVNREN